ncbi:hypothetical protein AYI70_g4095 [Smittium culicis]|uniref:Uncharacterized protein n=1 Tax=Smittium culicis TaxID=133412 RepID=A0A1R1Y0X5_9FUNG|nr:hypothetical protein AYI70_g4095 [Smittium culicis]
MLNSNIISGYYEHISISATCLKNDNGDTRSRNQKIFAIQQQVVVLGCFEDMRSILKAQGLTDNGIKIIVSEQSSAKRRSR